MSCPGTGCHNAVAAKYPGLLGFALATHLQCTYCFNKRVWGEDGEVLCRRLRAKPSSSDVASPSSNHCCHLAANGHKPMKREQFILRSAGHIFVQRLSKTFISGLTEEKKVWKALVIDPSLTEQKSIGFRITKNTISDLMLFGGSVISLRRLLTVELLWIFVSFLMSSCPHLVYTWTVFCLFHFAFCWVTPTYLCCVFIPTIISRHFLNDLVCFLA